MFKCQEKKLSKIKSNFKLRHYLEKTSLNIGKKWSLIQDSFKKTPTLPSLEERLANLGITIPRGMVISPEDKDDHEIQGLSSIKL